MGFSLVGILEKGLDDALQSILHPACGFYFLHRLTK